MNFFMLFLLVFTALKAGGGIQGGDGNNNTKWFNTKHFEIRFKNIFKKCWMEFANPCPNQTVLIMLTMSRRHGFENRKGIRQTWMNDSVPGEVIRFLIADVRDGGSGRCSKEVGGGAGGTWRFGVSAWLRRHLRTHSFEVVRCLKMATIVLCQCQMGNESGRRRAGAFATLAHWTEKTFRPMAVQNPLVYFGNIFHLSRPHRNPKSKWYISKDVYPKDMYTDFMQGTVYLTTPATINAILLYTRQTDGFYLDDVLYTGILAELANVTLSEQQKHFMWFFNFDEKNGQCEDGVPTPFLIWGAKKLNVFEHQYGRMKSIECKKN